MSKLGKSPALILATYLISEGHMTTPTDNGSWPLYVNHLPDTKDDAGVIYDTSGTSDGRTMRGSVSLHYEVVIKIRSWDHQLGYVKTEAIGMILDDVLNAAVTLGGNNYTIRNASRMSPVSSLGIEGGTKRRWLHEMAYLLTVVKI